MSTPGSDAGDAGEFGAVPAVAALDVVDPALAAGAPFDLLPERSPVLDLPARGAGLVLARDRDDADAELVQVVLDLRLAVTVWSRMTPSSLSTSWAF